MKQRRESHLETCSARLAHVGIAVQYLDLDEYHEDELDFDDDAAYLDKQPQHKK